MLLHIRDKNGELLYWSKRSGDNTVRIGSMNKYDGVPERELTYVEYVKCLKINGYTEHMPYWKRKNIVKNKNSLGWSR